MQKRNPVNESDVVLDDNMMNVCRLSAKFCPMPRGPLDQHDLFLGFERFSNNLKWQWFHHKRKKRRLDDESEEEDDGEDDFTMVPWYRRSQRRPPDGNPQLEAGLQRLRNHLFDANNRRKITDNLTKEDREAIVRLRNIPNTSNGQVTFEDKGGRFVIRNLNYQDQRIFEQLENPDQFDTLAADPTKRVIEKIEAFCDKWEDVLNDFHPNIKNFLCDIDRTKPSVTKGLVKCHKNPREDGWHDIRLLLSACNTPIKPASKLFQFSIAHIFPKLTSKMKDTKAILLKILNINTIFNNDLPPSAVNVGCDVFKLYPQQLFLLKLRSRQGCSMIIAMLTYALQ